MTCLDCPEKVPAIRELALIREIRALYMYHKQQSVKTRSTDRQSEATLALLVNLRCDCHHQKASQEEDDPRVVKQRGADVACLDILDVTQQNNVRFLFLALLADARAFLALCHVYRK